MLKRYAVEKNCSVKDRMMLAIHVERDGHSISDAAHSLGKSTAWGYKWYNRYKESGFDKLADRPRPGRPTKASKAELKAIKKHAYSRDIWTAHEMQECIKKKTGVTYSLPSVRRILRSWGYSQKVPVGKHTQGTGR